MGTWAYKLSFETLELTYDKKEEFLDLSCQGDRQSDLMTSNSVPLRVSSPVQ